MGEGGDNMLSEEIANKMCLEIDLSKRHINDLSIEIAEWASSQKNTLSTTFDVKDISIIARIDGHTLSISYTPVQASRNGMNIENGRGFSFSLQINT